MSKRVLVKADGAASPITYVRGIGDRGGGFLQDAATMFGRAYTPSQQNKFQKVPVSGGERFRAAANLLGRGAAAGLTGLQTAYGLQGGNVGALGQIGDVYGQNVQGLTPFGPSQAQQAANMTEQIQAEADRKAREEYVQNQIAQNMQQPQQRKDPTQAPQTTQAPPTTQSLYGPTIDGQMTFNVQEQQPTAPATPAAPTTNNTGDIANIAQIVGQTDVPTAESAPVQPVQSPPAASQPAASPPVQSPPNIFTVSGVPGWPSQKTQSASYQPSQKEQELIQRTAAQSGYFQQGELNTLNQHRQSQGLPPLSLEEALALAKSFVEYAYELHGDILRKATPHEAGLFVMNMYFEMLR